MRSLPFARIAALAVALVTSVACSSAPGPDQQQASRGGDSAPSEISVIGDGSEAATDIGPEGGTVAHSSGAKIVVPAGALAKRTHITLKAKSAPSTKTLAATPLGVGYEAGPDGQKFLKPVKLVIPFESGRLLPNVDANNAQVRMAPRGSTSFEALVSRVNLVSHTLETETVHFTDFVPAQDPNPVFINEPISSTLPNAKAGDFYSVQIGAVGGFNPHSFTVASGALPNGLNLETNGSLNGIPTAAAASAFFVKATDDTGRSVQRAFSLTVDQANNPEPTLNHTTQTSAEAGSGDTTISFIGYDFVPSSVATWDNSALPTTYVSPNELAATIPASLLTTPSMHLVAVSTPPPGGGTSAAVWFTVTEVVVPPNPVPTIVSVDTTTIPITTNDTQIMIEGTDFLATTSAAIEGQGLSTYFISPTSLYATIPASYLSTNATLQIAVYNPPPGGGFSATTVPVIVGTGAPPPAIPHTYCSAHPFPGSACNPVVENFCSYIIGCENIGGASVQRTRQCTCVGNTWSNCVVSHAPCPF